MAKGRHAEPAKPVQSESSSEEGTHDGSTEGSESESDFRMNLNYSGEKPEAESSSEDGEEEGEGSEAESGSGSDDSIATRSMKSEPEKPASRPDEEPVSLKRPPTDAKASAAKKPKQKEPVIENSEKKQLFQRLWSEEDEINILKGMIEYCAQKKVDPLADVDDFHKFIKKSIHIDVSRTQLLRKIKKMKSKFENNKRREKIGKNRTFSKAHERDAYELSKKMWGAGSAANGETSTEKKSSKAVSEANAAQVRIGDASKGKKENMLTVIAERIVKMGSEAFEGGKAGERGEEWKQLRIREFELHNALLEVKKVQAEMVLGFLKS